MMCRNASFGKILKQKNQVWKNSFDDSVNGDLSFFIWEEVEATVKLETKAKIQSINVIIFAGQFCLSSIKLEF